MSELLKSYNKEVIPMFLGLAESKALLKEKVDADTIVQEFKEQIKEMQSAIKEHLEDSYGNTVREIKAYETDIKLACQAAAKGSDHKPAELKAFWAARASEKVSKVVEKGETFQQLESEIG